MYRECYDDSCGRTRRSQGPEPMTKRSLSLVAGYAAMALMLVGLTRPAQAGKLSWLDDIVREVIAEAKSGGKTLVRGSEGGHVELRAAGRLFAGRDAEEGLEQLVKHSDELARAGRRIDQPTEALLQSRFSRLLG